MSTTADLVSLPKKELKAAQMTCAELARRVADAQPMQTEMTPEQHRAVVADQKLPEADREGYTLLLAMRNWEFEAFAALRR